MTTPAMQDEPADIERKPVTEGEVARGAATALLARFGAVIELISQPAYTWLFSVATYGVYTVLWAAVAFLLAITLIWLIFAVPLAIALTIWILYRVIRGWMTLSKGRPMALKK